jgi:hypothetical protein
VPQIAAHTIAAAARLAQPRREVAEPRDLDLQARLARVRVAVEDLEEATLDATATKYLHLAVAQATDGQVANARKALEKANQLGLKPEVLPPADRARLEKLELVLAENGDSSAPSATP